MKSDKISNNLEELLIFLMQDQLNDESSELIKEIIVLNKININSTNTNLTKSLLIKTFSNNIKNISQIYIENILDKLNNLDFIEYNTTEEEISFKTDNILNILFYPRYCYYINNKYGPKCLKIFEYLLEFGFYQDDMDKFNKNDFISLIRNGVIVKNKIKNTKDENLIFNNNNIEVYKINFKLLNENLFKEYLINFYQKYISMNFQYYDLFKKVINSNNYIYELKNYEKNNNQLLSQILVDNFDYGNLLIKAANDINSNSDYKITINKEMIKYDLFYNSVEKIINIFFSSKHIRIFKIIELNENLNLFQISQKACLKYLEVQEIIDDLINKLKIIKKLKIKKDKDKEDFIYLLNEVDESILNMMKNNIYGIIKNIKYELKDKLKQFQGKIDQDTILQNINKYYSLINTFSEILNAYNFLFN